MTAVFNLVFNLFFGWMPAQFQVVASALLAVVAVIVALRILALIWDAIPIL